MIKKFSIILSTTIKPALFCLAVACLVMTGQALIVNNTVFAVNKTPATILVLGDSLSAAYGININEGWVALLQQQVINEGYDYKVINASVSGDTTRTGLSRINSTLKSHKPEIVIIALGGNDGLRGLAFSEIENSLSSIIEACKNQHAETLLLGVRLPPNYGPVYNKQFAELYQRLAEHFDIILLPKMLDQVADNRDLMQDDGIHPKAKAQPLIMKNVWASLKSILEKEKDNK